jgi:hypothetical protein
MRQMTGAGRKIEDSSFDIVNREAWPHDFDRAHWEVVRRIIHATAETGGFYRYIVEEDAGSGCVNSDFSTHLTELGVLLEDLDTAFQLQSVPDVSTIQVWLDGEEVPKAPPIVNAATGETTYAEGWSYDSGKNAVVFWGEWVPDYNADVEIFYRPLSDKPRDLPF